MIPEDVFPVVLVVLGFGVLICVLATWRARQTRETWTVEDTLFSISLIFTGLFIVYFDPFKDWMEGKSRDRDQA